MLKTPPQDFRAGVISATASDKTAQLGNPCADLGQRGRLCGGLRDTRDGTLVQRFVSPCQVNFAMRQR
jgi:hypothetical protein